MASERPTLHAERREVTGKQVKRLRRRGRIPGVVYGKGFDSQIVTVPAREFRRLYQEVGGNTLVRLEIEGAEENVLIHEPDRDPVTGDEYHVDFYRVNMNEKITTEVPLRFVGEAPAVRALDGTLIRARDAVEVECLPAELPHEIEVDLEGLVDFDASVHVGDLKIPTGVEVLTESEELVARVEPPRSDEELEELEEVPEEEMPELEAGGEEGTEGEEGAESTEQPPPEPEK